MQKGVGQRPHEWGCLRPGWLLCSNIQQAHPPLSCLAYYPHMRGTRAWCRCPSTAFSRHSKTGAKLQPQLFAPFAQTRDESVVPLSINCWPSISGGESFVNIE